MPSQAGARVTDECLINIHRLCPDYNEFSEFPILGAYIKGRFTQKDLDQKAVRYVIAADMEVTADSFEFQVTDPAGNTMLPEVYIYSFVDHLFRYQY